MKEQELIQKFRDYGFTLHINTRNGMSSDERIKWMVKAVLPDCRIAHFESIGATFEDALQDLYKEVNKLSELVGGFKDASEIKRA